MNARIVPCPGIKAGHVIYDNNFADTVDAGDPAGADKIFMNTGGSQKF